MKVEKGKNRRKLTLLKVQDVLLLVFAALLPFDLKVQSPVLIVLLLVSLFLLEKEALKQNCKFFAPYFIAFIALFLWQIISLLWTSDILFGLKKVERRAFFLAAPLLFILIKNISYSRTVKAFLTGNMFICLSGFVYLIYFFFTVKMYFIESTLEKGFTRETLTYLIFHGRNNFIFLDLHRSYLSFSLLTSILLLFFSKEQYLKPKLKYFVVITMSFVIFLLQAKMAVIILFLILVGILVIEIRRRSKRFRLIYTVTFGIILITGAYISSPRFARLANEVSEISESTEGSLIERVQYTKSAMSLIADAPVLGYGFGDVQRVMRQRMNQIANPGNKELPSYDPHNEFLKVFVGTGIIGFFIFVGAFTIPLYLCFRENNRVLGIFLFMVLFVCLVEPFLSRQMGIMITLFFIGLLAGLGRKRTSIGY